MSPKKSEIKPKTLFAKRLKFLLNDQSLRSFEAENKLPNGTIGKYLNGRYPNYEALVTIVKATGCNGHWLITGEGEPFVK